MSTHGVGSASQVPSLDAILVVAFDVGIFLGWLFIAVGVGQVILKLVNKTELDLRAFIWVVGGVLLLSFCSNPSAFLGISTPVADL